MRFLLLPVALLLVFLSSARAGAFPDFSGGRYVNMGSSFAAGSGVDPVRPGSVPRCRQSGENYASLLAERLDLELEDRSCAGATSKHLLEPWKDLPPQIEAVNRDTRLVTITVGGNDLNYVRNLVAASCIVEEGLSFGGKKMPCFAEERVVEEVYEALVFNLRQISERIAQRAPQAMIVFIQYVTLIPSELCDATPLTPDEGHRLRRIGVRLAAITASVASESGAMLLSTDTLSALHTACDVDPWSIGGRTTANNMDGIIWHPNRRGNAIIAQRLQEMLSP
ncbi:MAG: SGNH/GDSL hydrolase family protein [Pseudomonadales bacterium]